MGAEGSVTLQLREAVQAPDAGTSLEHGGLTIGYPDPEMLADMLGSFQSASAGAAGLGSDQPSASSGVAIGNTAFDLIQDSSSSNCSNSRQSVSGLDPVAEQHCIASALLAKASSPTGSSSSSSSGSSSSCSANSSSNGNANGSSSLTLSGIKSEIGKWNWNFFPS